MDRVGENSGGGCPQAPAVRLRNNTEVTPTGVGIRASGHPWHWGCLRPGGPGAEGRLHSGPLPGTWRGNTREASHPPAHEIGGPGPPRPNKNGP